MAQQRQQQTPIYKEGTIEYKKPTAPKITCEVKVSTDSSRFEFTIKKLKKSANTMWTMVTDLAEYRPVMEEGFKLHKLAQTVTENKLPEGEFKATFELKYINDVKNSVNHLGKEGFLSEKDVQTCKDSLEKLQNIRTTKVAFGHNKTDL